MKTADFKELMDNAWKKYKGKLSRAKWEKRYKIFYKNRNIKENSQKISLKNYRRIPKQI